ncbi:hypothetical protein CP03DC29_0728A, partial [Chlamydia psittaci 03DC29]
MENSVIESMAADKIGIDK